tara:strand:- start:199 stop:342 length:144 start_codon:yes stop_codon:yes gene_type:complete
VLVDSGSPYELYRHIANKADHAALMYIEYEGREVDYITIERIEEYDK